MIGVGCSVTVCQVGKPTIISFTNSKYIASLRLFSIAWSLDSLAIASVIYM